MKNINAKITSLKEKYDCNIEVIFVEATDISSSEIRMHLSEHKDEIPNQIYKYIKEFNGVLPSIVSQSIKTEFDDFLNKTLKERRESLNLGEFTIKDLRKDYGDMRCLEYIPLLNKDKIFIEELSEFLQYILTEYPKLLSTEGKQSDRTNLKRLIRIYDWIKYYK